MWSKFPQKFNNINLIDLLQLIPQPFELFGIRQFDQLLSFLICKRHVYYPLSQMSFGNIIPLFAVSCHPEFGGKALCEGVKNHEKYRPLTSSVGISSPVQIRKAFSP